MPAVCTRPTRRLLFVSVGLLLVLPALAAAQAPPRAGQPYAEAALCARPDVLFCEDFDYPENFVYTGVIQNYNSIWRNPGLTTGTFGYVYGLEGRRINPATTYPAQPAGSPAGGSVWVANWDATKGQTGNGATWGRLREVGKSYANGSPPAKDLYIRFQYYVTPDYAWPGDPRSDAYAFGSSSYPVDNKILYIFPPEGVENPTGAAYDAGLYTTVVYDPTTNSRFTDALALRYGDASDNYKHFPMDWDATSNPAHMEYGPFQSTTLRNPGDTPTLGKIFRLDTNRWYTIELRYVLGSGAGVRDGGIEVWIDGTKVYGAFDLATCGGGLGDCSGIGALYLGAYHNGADTTRWDGQQVVDNLVIARSYIGPPDGGAGPPPPSTAALTVSREGLGSGTVSSSPAGIACGTDCSQEYGLGTTVSLTAAATAGSSFAGWSGDCSGTGTCTVTVRQACAVRAAFVQQPAPTVALTVAKAGTGAGTVTSAPAGIACGTDCGESYPLDTAVTLTAAPAAGSTFAGWSGACTGTGACSLRMSQARTATATFTALPRTATLTVSRTGAGAGSVSSSPAGIACGRDCSQTYAYNTSVALTATPAAGSTFAGWSGACTGSGSCRVSMSRPRSATATFSVAQVQAAPLTVTKAGAGAGTVSSSPAGILCGADCAEDYPLNTAVTLSAAPATGSLFAGWSGACTGTGPCTLSLSQARAVAATFSLPAAGGPVAAYSFNSSSGSSLPDASGNGHTGAIRGARWTSGRYGNALQFDGSDDWVTVPDAPDLDLASGMTLMAWVYPTSSYGTRDVLIKEGAGYEIYNLYARQYGAPGSQATARVNGSLREVTGPALPPNVWSHLASSYDGTTLRLYVNGVQRAQLTVGGPIATSSGVLRLGGNSLWGEFFQGKIDEVRIYSRALDASEIQAGMNTPVQ
jgi:hypothetical protein